MGDKLSLSPQDFLDKKVKRLENDPAVKRIIRELGGEGIVIGDIQRAFEDKVRTDLITAKTNEELELHRDRRADAKFIPYFLRTKYQDRITGMYVPSHPSDAELVPLWGSPY